MSDADMEVVSGLLYSIFFSIPLLRKWIIGKLEPVDGRPTARVKLVSFLLTTVITIANITLLFCIVYGTTVDITNIKSFCIALAAAAVIIAAVSYVHSQSKKIDQKIITTICSPENAGHVSKTERVFRDRG